MMTYQAAVITVSDKGSMGERVDTSDRLSAPCWRAPAIRWCIPPSCLTTS